MSWSLRWWGTLLLSCDRITKMIQDVQAAAADSSVDSLVLRARGSGVIKWLHPMEPSTSLVQDIKRLLGKFEQILVKHVFREAFAKNGLGLLMPFRVYNVLPSFSYIPMMFDSCNTLHSRGDGS